MTGLDRQRADAAGQQIAPVPGLASTTAAGLARRITPAQWRAVEAGGAQVPGGCRKCCPDRAAALTGVPVTIDLDTTDVEQIRRGRARVIGAVAQVGGQDNLGLGLGGHVRPPHLLALVVIGHTTLLRP